MFFQRGEGLFITLEGGEGSGKTTLARHLETHLRQRGIPCLLVREPGATVLGEKIRNILLDREDMAVDPMSELLLFLAARAQNLQENIRPAIRNRMVVICDRYNDSSMAYQAAARGLKHEVVAKLCELATGGLEPHLTLFLDIDPIIGCKRAAQAKQGIDSIEKESLDFHNCVRQSYLELVVAHPQRMMRLNANQPLEKFLEDGLNIVIAALKKHSLFEEMLAHSKKHSGT